MTRIRESVGVAAVLVGLVLAITGPAVGASDVATVLALFAGFAVVAAGTARAAGRLAADFDRWRPSDPEPGQSVPVPGDEYETLTGQARRERIRERVVASLTAVEDCSRAAASARVEDGTWTDDPLASTYLGDGTISLPAHVRFGGWIRGESVEERVHRRTIAALRRLREERGP